MNAKWEQLLLQVQKPARYTGGELHSVVKNKADVDVRFAFCFPDLYEVGMSHLGMKILYSQFNAQPHIWCERVFAPDDDMAELMQKEKTPLWALESGDPIGEFDFVGFTLQYEMSYPTMLYMLKLGQIPLRSADRDETYPLVVAGGPCTCNPEPLADFVDIFFIGEGEEVDLEVMELYRAHKQSGHYNKAAFLRAAAKIEGVYVPALYDVAYNEDGTIAAFTAKDGAPATVKKRIIKDLDHAYYPDKFVVPFTEIVHDRAVGEIFRGCIRGCRFCQAGFLYRPVREKSPDVIDKQCHDLCRSTGYEEFSLASLSTSDYTKIEELLPKLLSWTEVEKTNISLPSLRVDGFSEELVKRLNVLRRSGLTFAPEAGTQRLRDAINKNVSEEEVLETARRAFAGGWTSVKLYFMLGLPTETDEDVAGIAALGQKVVDEYYRNPNKPKGKSVSVSMSTACFIPKPFTPFQWEAQDTREELERKQQLLLGSLTSKKLTLHYHDAPTGLWEAVLARGDRKLCAVLETLADGNAHLDAWSEHFDPEAWDNAMCAHGLTAAFYAHRNRQSDEHLPWDHIDIGVTKEFLIKEREKAYASQTTPHCRLQCAGCGAACYGEGVCFERK